MIQIISETEEEKKTRNSPSKKVAALESRMDVFQQELQGLRDYVRRLEDHYIYKIGNNLPDPPVSVLPLVSMTHKRKKREKITEEEPLVELTEELDKMKKEEPVKKKRGRPKKNKSK